MTAGERFGIRPHPRFDAKEVCHFGDTSAHGVLRHADILEPERNFMPHGIAHDLRVWILHHVSDERGGIARRHGISRPAVNHQGNPQHIDVARTLPHRRKLGLEGTQQCGFAASGRAGEHAEGTLLYGERHIAKNPRGVPSGPSSRIGE